MRKSPENGWADELSLSDRYSIQNEEAFREDWNVLALDRKLIASSLLHISIDLVHVGPAFTTRSLRL